MVSLTEFAGVDLKRIEEAGLNGLQTQRQLFYDGWLLRVAAGNAKRARSVNAHFASSLPLSGKISYCERVYRERGLPVLFRITPFVQPPELEEALVARGYQAFETTLVQVLRLEFAPEPIFLPGIELTASPPPEFADAAARLVNATAAQRAALEGRLAESVLVTRALVAYDAGRAAGTGIATLEDGLAGIFTMVTARELRARGVASTILSALLTWAWEHGARHAYLQVDEDNHRALAVYRKFGFVTGYKYHYRGLPGECA